MEVTDRLREQIFISQDDQYLFGQGTHYEIYKKLGAHLTTVDGQDGVYFAVWAPNAAEVYVLLYVPYPLELLESYGHPLCPLSVLSHLKADEVYSCP